MSVNTENTSNAMDSIKWVLVIGLLGAAVAGNYMYGELSVLVRAVTVVAIVAIAGFIAATTAKGSQFLGFAKESRLEVRKVVWPTRQEATQTTLIVLAATVVAALVLWGLDGILVRLVSLVTGLGV
ncbi:preprotein translocase subunit SecE [Aliiglaciecola sp. CAU 1673]|uniref:preprotein translocase subunit SecE n=1 Tax=Aliiglaciecola sp. CAU 1673 TaxID=3032595 RepID=UPI0023DA7A90|nr:preprotein translocase subunit SecE [Aliiglaciecola sp. CAU 1673]MDF2178573.1 preprotein translocase subunit SecE [Aliiglaciecola sp. CAU 1673]